MDATSRKQHETMLQKHARVGAELTAATIEHLQSLLEEGRITAADTIRLLHEAIQLERGARSLLATRDEPPGPPVATTIIDLASLDEEQHEWERTHGYSHTQS